MVDIGPIPIGGSEIEQYYAKILELDQRYMGLQERYLGKDAISQGPDKQCENYHYNPRALLTSYI